MSRKYNTILVSSLNYRRKNYYYFTRGNVMFSVYQVKTVGLEQGERWVDWVMKSGSNSRVRRTGIPTLARVVISIRFCVGTRVCRGTPRITTRPDDPVRRARPHSCNNTELKTSMKPHTRRSRGKRETRLAICARTKMYEKRVDNYTTMTRDGPVADLEKEVRGVSRKVVINGILLKTGKT